MHPRLNRGQFLRDDRKIPRCFALGMTERQPQISRKNIRAFVAKQKKQPLIHRFFLISESVATPQRQRCEIFSVAKYFLKKVAWFL